MTDKWPLKRMIPTNRRNRGVIKGWNACHDAFMKVINDNNKCNHSIPLTGQKDCPYCNYEGRS